MRRWGVIITAFYLLAVVALLGPGLPWLLGENPFTSVHWGDIRFWILPGVLVGGEALLLFLSVDTSWRRHRPRQHLIVTVTFVALAMILLSFLAISSVAALDNFRSLDRWGSTAALAACVAWVVWGVLFSCYYRGSPRAVTAAVSWLLMGSVLELLIAVPAHVLVRRRNECSAPVATAFGIVTGLAIMLLSFGPGVLALYQKRLETYARPRRENPPVG